jgi:hypothetical protein
MVRYNSLKIFIAAGEAKPGGNIGAMLSPYLFSSNMIDFCKKFNEATRDYESGVLLCVKIFCDVVDKTYTFFIMLPSVSLVYMNFFRTFVGKKRILFVSLFDLARYCSFVFGLSLYSSSKIMFGVIRSFRKRRILLDFGDLKVLEFIN